MQVETTRFGTLTVSDDARVYFPEGLLGFGAYREYVMVPVGPAGGPLVWLQSCQAAELAFALCRADAVAGDGYRVQVRPEDLAVTELTDHERAAVYVIVHRERGDLVANLRGPLVINQERGLGKQVVMNDERVPLRYRLKSAAPQESAPAQARRKAV